MKRNARRIFGIHCPTFAKPWEKWELSTPDVTTAAEKQVVERAGRQRRPDNHHGADALKSHSHVGPGVIPRGTPGPHLDILAMRTRAAIVAELSGQGFISSGSTITVL